MMTRAWRHRLAPLVFVLLVLVSLQQSLGLLHAVVHHVGTVPAVAVPLQAVGSEPGFQAGLGSLFSGHEDGGADCRLFDQCSHGDALTSLPPLALPLAPAPFVVWLLAGLTLARWHALFQARGPPRVR